MVKHTRFGLDGATMKLVACALMLIDHIGYYLFPSMIGWRIVGRLAFPLFAFFVAEGCRYTRHKPKRFFTIFGVGLLCEILYILRYGHYDGNVFFTFSLSVLLIFLWQAVKAQMAKGLWRGGLSVAGYALVLIGVFEFVKIVPVEYGFFGVTAPLAAAAFDYEDGKAPRFMKAFDCLPVKLLMFGAALLLLSWRSLQSGGVQGWCLLSLPLLMLYNGKAGSHRLKYGFYVFYPAHLIVLEIVREMVR